MASGGIPVLAEFLNGRGSRPAERLSQQPSGPRNGPRPWRGRESVYALVRILTKTSVGNRRDQWAGRGGHIEQCGLYQPCINRGIRSDAAAATEKGWECGGPRCRAARGSPRHRNTVGRNPTGTQGPTVQHYPEPALRWERLARSVGLSVLHPPRPPLWSGALSETRADHPPDCGPHPAPCVSNICSYRLPVGVATIWTSPGKSRMKAGRWRC